jgi:hypothetical protein
VTRYGIVSRFFGKSAVLLFFSLVIVGRFIKYIKRGSVVQVKEVKIAHRLPYPFSSPGIAYA